MATRPAPIEDSTVWEGSGECLAPEALSCPDDCDNASEGEEETDALMRSAPLWAESFSIGEAASTGDEGSTQQRQYGQYWSRSARSTYVYSLTGGRCGGGYVQAVTDAWFEMQSFNVGNSDASEPLTGEIEAAEVNQRGLLTIHDLLGTTSIVARELQRFSQHSRIVVLPNHTIQAQRWDGVSAWTPYTGATSTETVPATGIFAIETEVGATPAGYRVGGFVQTRLYTSDGPVLGTRMVRLIGSPTNIVSTNTIDSTRLGVPAGTRCHGAVGTGPYGERRAWQYDLLVGAALPSGDDETASEVGHAHAETFMLDLDDSPKLISTDLTWGVVERWRNVRSLLRSANEATERLTSEWQMGVVGDATSHWLDGAPVLPTPETIVRNTLWGGRDFYRVTFDSTVPPAEIVAVSPVALIGARIRQGTFDFFFGASHQKIPWMFTGPKPAGTMNYADPIGSPHHQYTLALKEADGTIRTGRTWRGLPGTVGTIGQESAWRSMRGYQVGARPSLFLARADGSPWPVDGLPSVGVVADFSGLDAIEGLDPGDRWLHVDIGFAALVVVFRARTIPALVEPALDPLADLRIFSSSVPTGTISVYDASVDFNGAHTELISGIVSRVIDWGDGTTTVLAGGGSANRVTKVYTEQGIERTITLTVTNALGRTATASLSFTPLGTLTADFSAEPDADEDETGLTWDFTDESTLTLGTIVSETWDFGDGSDVSTEHNPTHGYTDYGTYSVTHTVTDNLGRTATITSDIEVTAPGGGGGGGCGLSATALTVPNPAGVQADDFSGGNARFPNYLSTTSLRNYLWDQSPYRALYDSAYGHAATDYELDPVETFGGGPSLKHLLFGDGYGNMSSGFSSDTTNLGDDADFSDSRTTGVVARIIFKVNQEMVDLVNGITNDDRGLQLLTVAGPSSYAPVMFRNGGHVYLQVQTRLTPDAPQTTRETIDLGAFPELVAGDWCELIVFALADDDAHTTRNMVWFGPACSLAGASPKADRTNTANTGHSGGGFLLPITFDEVVSMYYYNAGFATFSDPKPTIWMRPLEIHHPVTAADVASRFGVSLV